MFSLLESKEEIAKAQRKLETTFRREFKQKVVKNIGYPGGTEFNATVFTDGNYWYWTNDLKGSKEPNPRQLNWFGIFQNKPSLDISVEINTPYEGRNNQIAGFFARDNDTGSIYLFHSGGVRGGMKGVSQTAFLAWSDKKLTEIADVSGEIRHGVLVMPIDAKAATVSAVRYTKQIADFKQAVRAGETDTPNAQHKQKEFADFYSESRGRRKGTRSSEFDYLSRHGDVVEALSSWRKSKPLRKGGWVVKNVFIDLGVLPLVRN